MPTFLTVKEAAKQTGKSSSSVRRVLYPILKDDKHPDRKHILPSPEEALQLRLKGENFAWQLSEELVTREFPVGAAAEHGPATASAKLASGSSDGELLAMLRRELDIKNQQITQQAELFSKQMELITGLSERLREGNILIASLQQRLALTDGRENRPPESAKAKSITPTKPEKGNATPPKATKPKRGLFSRLFR